MAARKIKRREPELTLQSEIVEFIKTILNDGLPQIYDKTIFDQKRVSIYDYVYETM